MSTWCVMMDIIEPHAYAAAQHRKACCHQSRLSMYMQPKRQRPLLVEAYLIARAAMRRGDDEVAFARGPTPSPPYDSQVISTKSIGETAFWETIPR